MASFVLLVLPILALLAGATGQSCTTTTRAIEGPYCKAGAPFRTAGTICDYQQIPNGTQLLVQGRVYNAKRGADQSALLDVWQADPAGSCAMATGDYTRRGKPNTDANGNYQMLTAIPGRYKDGDSYRPAHVHFKISPSSQSSSKDILTTQMYFQGDPYIPIDPCNLHVCHAGDPTLMFPLEPESDKSYMVRFDIVLHKK